MKRFILTANVLLICLLSYAQGQKVPSRMTFADLKLKITESGRKVLQKEVDAITQSPKYFNVKVEKANIYFPMIERAYQEEGVPDDFKYLALQESALIPDAVSSSNAVGYWQFKDFTAIEVGMRVDKHIDERKNIYASSRGAARYMKKNNAYFDNWLYALQAYQMGAGAAMKILNKKNYGAKSLVITDKTYWYVITFLAHKIAYEPAISRSNPAIILVGYTDVEGKNLHDVAKETNANLENLQHYNQWLRKGRIPGDREYTVILPTSQLSSLKLDGHKSKPKTVLRKVPEFDEAQADKYPKIDDDYHSKYPLIVKINGLHGVLAREGDAIRDIAKAGMVDIGKLLKFNDIEIDHRVVPGEVYYIRKKKSKAKVYYHILADGESLWTVAQKYGIKLSKLKLKNRITEAEELKPGRVLWLRHIRPVSVPIGYKKYKSIRPLLLPTIQNTPTQIESTTVGEENEEILDKPISTDSVSIVYEPSVDDSATANSGGEQNNSFQEPMHESKLIVHVHVIKAGETLYRISKIYDVEVMEIVEWNSIDLTVSINPGDELLIKAAIARKKNDKVVNQLENEVELSTHTVSAGETLYSIARQYGVSVQQIQEWNNLENNTLSVGDQLKVVKPLND